MLTEIVRPLRIVEVLAETFRIYGRRPVAFVAVGAAESGVRAASLADVPLLADLALLACSFVLAFSACTLIAAGHGLRTGLGAAARAAPMLLLLIPVIGVPAALSFVDPIFLLLAMLWLSVASYAVPLTLVGAAPAGTALSRFGDAMQRTGPLARVAFAHGLGVVVILYVIVLLFSLLLAGALNSFGDQTQTAALLIANAVLAPVLFIGLAVLWAEQTARALEVYGPPRTRR